MSVKNYVNGGKNKLTCLNQHKTVMVEWS